MGIPIFVIHIYMYLERLCTDGYMLNPSILQVHITNMKWANLAREIQVTKKLKVKTRGCCKRLHFDELMNCCGTSRHWSDLILDVLVSSYYLFIHGLATGGWEVTDMVQRITSYTPDVDHDEKQGWIHVIIT